MPLKWDDVRVFVALCESGSLKGAGAALGVDHSTVSRRLAALEEALGGPVFDRTKTGIKLNSVGLAIEPYARQVAGSIADLTTKAATMFGSADGPVRIAASPILAMDFLIPRLAQLQERFPDVTFDTMAGIARVDISRHEADLAIRTHPKGASPGGAADLARKAGTFGFAVYASCGYLSKFGTPQRPIRGLDGHRIVVASATSPGSKWNETLEPPAEQALIAFPYASTMAAVMSGIGVALLPCVMADKQAQLQRVSDLILEWDVWVVTSKQHRHSALIRDVKETLLEMLSDAGPELSGRAEA